MVGTFVDIGSLGVVGPDVPVPGVAVIPGPREADVPVPGVNVIPGPREADVPGTVEAVVTVPGKQI